MQTENKTEENILNLHRGMKDKGEIRIVYGDRGSIRGINRSERFAHRKYNQRYFVASELKEKLDPVPA